MDITERRRALITQLAAARMEKGMTQAQLARAIGTQRSNICRLESGSQNLTLDMFFKIADALGKEPSILLSDREENMESIYLLKIFDTPLVRFGLTDGGLEGYRARIIDVHEDQKHLFPLNLILNDDGILRWLEGRVIPKNRRYVEEILAVFGLSLNDTKGIIDVCKGLSLNDCYWVVGKDFDGTFAQYNLYENRFSEILSLVAYTGAEQSHGGFTTSPELTTGGMLPKAWRYLEGDGIYLYKGGNTILTHGNKEPYSEYYASQIAETMGLNAVHYDLEHWKGILASKCRLFCDLDTSYVPIGHILPKCTLKDCIDYYDSLGTDFGEQIRSMLVFDALVYNEDRHFGNFGILRDNHSGKIIAPAPIFDNGLALFSQASPEKYNDLEAYAKTLTTPYRGLTFDKIAAEVIGKTQIAQLRRMIGFTFTRHPSINLPEEHLRAMEKFVQKRASYMIALARTRTKSKDELTFTDR